jgi:hypothetical protein
MGQDVTLPGARNHTHVIRSLEDITDSACSESNCLAGNLIATLSDPDGTAWWGVNP